MIFGLPFWTFFLAFGTMVIAIIMAVVYGLTYKAEDEWWTVDDMFGAREEETAPYGN